jgi:hypothetical protein
VKKPKQPIKTKLVVQVYKDEEVSDTCRLTFEVWFHKWTDSLNDRELVNYTIELSKPRMWEAWKAGWMTKKQMGAIP